MGCSQSKSSTDQVVERVSVDTPAVEAPAPESVDISTSEPAVEAPPASEDLPPAPASVPVEAAEEVEEPAVEEAPKTEETAPVEEPPKSEEAALVEEPVVEEATEEVPEAAKTEEKIPEAEPEDTPVEDEAPKSEHVAEEEAPKSETVEAPVEAPIEETPVEAPVQEETPAEEVPTEEPKVEAVAPVSEVKPAVQAVLTFKPEEVTFNDKGVAFYNFDGSDSSNPADDVHVSKRYSEFKALHAQLTQQLADNQDDKTLDLPALPKASILQGRKNKKMLEDRKTQFTTLLNAIASHPVASQSDVFKAFLA